METPTLLSVTGFPSDAWSYVDFVLAAKEQALKEWLKPSVIPPTFLITNKAVWAQVRAAFHTIKD